MTWKNHFRKKKQIPQTPFTEGGALMDPSLQRGAGVISNFAGYMRVSILIPNLSASSGQAPRRNSTYAKVSLQRGSGGFFPAALRQAQGDKPTPFKILFQQSVRGGVASAILCWVFVSIFQLSVVPGSHAFQLFEKSAPVLPPPFYLKVEAVPDPEKVQTGKRFELHVRLNLAEGWHVYSLELKGDERLLATRIRLDENVFSAEGLWKEPPPKIIMDGALQKIVKAHHGLVDFTRFFHVPDKLESGYHSISGALVVRACDNKVCTLPSEIKFSTRVLIGNQTNPVK